MSEEKFDSSINNYIEENNLRDNEKQLNWDMAIGLQKVDNLNPS